MISLVSAGAADPLVERGQYLVNFGGCFDCHTPGYFFGKPDMARYLGGSDVGFEIPGLGVFVGPNLTPDKETGLGTWNLSLGGGHRPARCETKLAGRFRIQLPEQMTLSCSLPNCVTVCPFLYRRRRWPRN
jgi:hypothetical protein